jgi:hypothetical protein
MIYKELVISDLSETKNAQLIFHIEEQKNGIPVYQNRVKYWEFL